MQLSLCIAVLAALSSSANGHVFRDRITQDVDGTTLNLVHGLQGEAEVTLDVDQHDLGANAWELDTDGQIHTDAVIRPLNAFITLVCKEGSSCTLEPEGPESQVFRIERASGATKFSFQDTLSSLYVSRSADLHLELTPELSEAGYFILHKIPGKLLYS